MRWEDAPAGTRPQDRAALRGQEAVGLALHLARGAERGEEPGEEVRATRGAGPHARDPVLGNRSDHDFADFEGEAQIFEKSFETAIPRDFM